MSDVQVPRAAIAPVVIFDRVHARAPLTAEGRRRGAVADLSISLRAGTHAFLGGPEDGTFAIASVVAGESPPQRGRVLVLGREPARTPSLRARIGVLGPEPRLPPAASVEALIRLATRARGEIDARPDAVLAPFGLSALAGRSPRSLAFAEQRAVELALALTTPSPLVLVLHEPLSDVALPDRPAVRSRLIDLAASGACVLVTTSSPSDAHALAARVFVLHRGVLGRELDHPEYVIPGEVVELTAWVDAGSGARELAERIGRYSDILGVTWEEPTPDDAARHGGATVARPALVRVRSRYAGACAYVIADASLALGVPVEAIAPTGPSLGEVRSTSEALFRMRGSRAFASQAAAPQVRLSPPAPPPAPAPPAPPAPPTPPSPASLPPPPEDER